MRPIDVDGAPACSGVPWLIALIGMTLFQTCLIVIGACVGGFVSGLAGFGTGITAMGIWLYAVSPSVASSLVVICSVQTLPAIWRSVEPRRVLPFILPGLIGVPIGTVMLSMVDGRLLKLGIGMLLLVFSVQMLLSKARPVQHWGGRRADGAIGFGAGVIGGLVGLSGVLPTMWATWRGWNKPVTRSLLQTFNLSILGAALVAHAMAGMLTAEVGWAVLAALPGTIGGARLGAHAYTRMSDQRFRVIILTLLFLSGCGLVWANR